MSSAKQPKRRRYNLRTDDAELDAWRAVAEAQHKTDLAEWLRGLAWREVERHRRAERPNDRS